MLKRLIVLSVPLLFLGFSSSYFERKFWCNVDQGSIVISLNSDNADQKCFTYFQSLATVLSEVDADIQQASNYITWGTDVEYWTEINDNLQKQRDIIVKKQNQVSLAVTDFERSLFNQVKNLLKFHLYEQRDAVLVQIDDMRDLLVETKLSGNVLLYQQQLSEMEELQVRLFLLDRIQFAHDFEELVPFLKEYLYGTGL